MQVAKGDLRFYYSDGVVSTIPGGGDIAVNGASLVRDSGFETSVIISLFTDARAEAGDVLPATAVSSGGYWGSVLTGFQWGSKFWLLSRSKINNTTLRLYEQYAQDALRWMVSAGIASDIIASASVNGKRVNMLLQIKRRFDTDVSFKFYINWEEQLAGAA